jgi:5'-nucleotidase
MTPALILLTNDDGVQAPGLRALAEALAPLGELRVVGPEREMSASSHGLTLHPPLRVIDLRPGVQSVSGTPADCVNLAVTRLLPRRPDLVVSGINRGANLGEDVFYSGTVGGAREGCFHGLPSMAVSLAVRNGIEADFAHAARFALRLARRVLVHGLPPGTLLNVNVPPGEPRGMKLTVQARREHAGAGHDALRRAAERPDLAPTGRETADIEAVRAGLVSLTPLHTDSTHHAALGALRAWEALDGDGAGAPGEVVAFRPRS